MPNCTKITRVSSSPSTPHGGDSAGVPLVAELAGASVGGGRRAAFSGSSLALTLTGDSADQPFLSVTLHSQAGAGSYLSREILPPPSSPAPHLGDSRP